ncbi:MAG: hypothetical protein C0490_18915 [Marivirga sp.]|nr:hypothetical protein [Marivirga sp.]
MENVTLRVIEYQPEHQPWFEKLNREWIERYFWMEPIDVEVLQHPDKHIIEKGGTILMANRADEIAGTVALKYVSPGVYEFTKMAVEEKFRGHKIGLALAEAAIEKAKQLRADKIILYSNTKLAPAISLYRKLGFVEVPVDGPYKRSDIKMELKLPKEPELIVDVASPKDAQALVDIGAKTFYETFASFNTAGDMKLYLEKNFTVPQLSLELNESANTFLLARIGETVVGYAKLRRIESPTELNERNSIELERIYSSKEYLGKSVGRKLMDACLKIGKEEGNKVIWLGVWEHNPRAIAFYEKCGFEKFASHPFMLGNDLQTDLLMKKTLI